MADDVATTALVFDNRGAQKGAEEFARAGRQIIDANRQVEQSLARTADQTERATQRVVTSLSSQNRMLDRLAKQFDPFNQAVAEAQKRVDQLNDVVAQGGENAARAASLLAGAQQKLAAAQRDLSTFQTTGSDPRAAAGQQAQLAAAAARYREALNPLLPLVREYKTAVGEINAATKAGLLTEAERSASLVRAKTEFTAARAALAGHDEATRAAAKTTQQYTNLLRGLSLQANDVGASIAAGISPMQTLAQQGPQVLQSFTKAAGGPGLLNAAMAVMGSTTGIVIAGVTAVGVALGALGLGYRASVVETKEFEKALQLQGTGLGLTAGEAKALGGTLGDLQGISHSAGREIVLAFTQAGTVTSGNLKAAAGLTRDFGAAMGVDATKAAEMLSAALANPARAATDLDRVFKNLDAATRQQIEDLQAQGRLSEAQGLLLDRIRPKIQGLADRDLTLLGRAWRDVAKAASDAWDWMTKASQAPTTAEAVAAASQRSSMIVGMANPYETQPRGARGKLQVARNPGQVAANANVDLAFALAEDAARQFGAQADQQAEARRRLILQGDDLAKSYATEAERISKLTNDYTLLTAAIAAAIEAGEKVPDRLTEGAARAKVIKDAVRSPEQAALDQAAGRERVAGASPRDRAYVQAAVTRQEREQALKDAGNLKAAEIATREYNAEIRQLGQSVAQLSAASKLNEAQTLAAARAYSLGTAEGLVADAKRQAALEALTQRTDQAARAQEILREALAAAAVEGAKSAQALTIQAEQAERLAQAARNGAAAEAEVERAIKLENATRQLQQQLKAAMIASNGQETETTRALRLALDDTTEAIKRTDAAERERLRAQGNVQADRDVEIARMQAQASLLLSADARRAADMAIERQMKLNELTDRYKGDQAAIAEQMGKFDQSAALRDQARYWGEVRETAQGVARDISNFLVDGFTGAYNAGKSIFSNLWQGVLGGVKRLVARIAATFVEQRIVMPVVTQIVGSVPGMFGIASAQGAGGGGGMSTMDMLGNAGTVARLGSNLSGDGGGIFNLFGGGGGAPTTFSTGLEGGGYMGGVTTSGGGGLFGDIGGLFSGNGALSASSINAFGADTFGLAASGAGSLMDIGSVAIPGIGAAISAGLSFSNGQIGTGVGTLAGAAIGTAILPGIGTAVGSMLGGLLGGLFDSKASPPGSTTDMGLSNGQLTVGKLGHFGGKGDPGAGPTRAIAQGLVDRFGAFNSAYNLHFSDATEGVRANFTHQGSTYGINAGGVLAETSDDPNKIAASAIGYYLTLRARGIGGAGAGLYSDAAGSVGIAQNTVLGRTSATTFDELAKELDAATEAANRYDAALTATGHATTQVESAMKSIADQMRKARDEAASYGLDVDRLRMEQARQFGESIDDQIKAMTDPLQAALDEQARNAQARLDLATELGADLSKVEQLNGMERTKIIEDAGRQQAEALRQAMQQASDALRSYLDGQALGDLSTLSPMEKEAEARRQFDSALSAARGDPSKVQNLVQAAQALKQIDQGLYGSTAAYGSRASFIDDTLRNLGRDLGLPGFAGGTGFAPGGMAVMNELGSETVFLPRGSKVVSARQSEQQAAEAAQVSATGFNAVVAELRSLRRQNADLKEEMRGIREWMKQAQG